MRKKKLFVCGILFSLLIIKTAFADMNQETQTWTKSLNINFGLYFGGFLNIASEAIEDYPFTKFRSGLMFGASAMFPMYRSFGLYIEGGAYHFNMNLEELGERLGTLRMTPIMILFKFQNKAKEKTGLSVYFCFGYGYSLNNFEKGPYLLKDEETLGMKWLIETGNCGVAELGLGIDYFLTKNLSIDAKVHYFGGEVNFSWDLATGKKIFGEDVIVDSVGNAFMVKNIHALFGLRYWF